MIYGKLPVSFLMALASEKNGSTNSAIAQTLLENLDAVRGMGIRELAAFCHVAPSRAAPAARCCSTGTAPLTAPPSPTPPGAAASPSTSPVFMPSPSTAGLPRSPAAASR